jgi:hypothetical protein
MPPSIFLVDGGFGSGDGRRVCKYLHRVNPRYSQMDEYVESSLVKTSSGIASSIRTVIVG